jgi:hypothetical protein
MTDNQPIRVGQYVRKIGEDMGTGKVRIMRQDTYLDNDEKVKRVTGYFVEWLDTAGLVGQPIRCWETAETIVPSARAVPQFANAAEAEAWMEAQLETGGWTAKVQDAADTVGDAVEDVMTSAVDDAIRQILEGDSPA